MIKIKKCLVCDNFFETSKKYPQKIVCSSSCAAKYGYLQKSEKRTCKYCSEIFRISKSSKRETCEKHRKSVIKRCEYCGEQKLMKKDASFCSLKCSGQHNAISFKKENCSECKKEFDILKISSAKNKNKFCSDKCKNEYYKKHSPKRLPSRYGDSWWEKRQEIISRDGYKCLMCNSSDNLQVHHFIKMKMFKNVEDSHYDDNLGTFCRTCHYKVEKINYTSYTNFMKDIVCTH